MDAIPNPPPIPTASQLYHFVPLAPPLPQSTALRVRSSSDDSDIISSASSSPPTPMRRASNHAVLTAPIVVDALTARASNASAPRSFFCNICLLDSDEGWVCSSFHSFCRSCLRMYIQGKISERLFVFKCPYSCNENVDDACVKELLGDGYVRYSKLIRLHQNKNMRACPTCSELVEGSESRPNMSCPCGQQFCFFHELSHVGKKCTRKGASTWQRACTATWTAIHTRKCPKCQHHIQKNGGCNHMTCRCGHEICWMCGENWIMPNGRRGHSFELFPSPSQLKYCCNGWKIWSMRVGAVSIAPAVIGLGIGVGLPALGAFLVGRMAYREYQDRARIRRQRRQNQHASRVATDYFAENRALFESDHCRGYYSSLNQESECLRCNGAVPHCSHTYITNDPDQSPFLCTSCGHWSMHDNACAHFFYPETAPCMFCHRTCDELYPQPQKDATLLSSNTLEFVQPAMSTAISESLLAAMAVYAAEQNSVSVHCSDLLFQPQEIEGGVETLV